MTAPVLAVTGATGRLGGAVARRLADAGVAQRLVVRDPDRAPVLPGAEVVVASYADGGAVRRALRGVDVVLLVSAAEAPDRIEQHRCFVDAAVDAGVQQVVYTSFFGASADATFTHGRVHWATEQHLRASPLRWTFLRDNLYADFLPDLVGEDGVIRGPAGTGRLAAVVRDDVADVAVAVLGDPDRHAGRTYDLTGPEDLSLADVAAILSTMTGQEVVYQEETVEQAYASRAAYGAPAWLLEAWVSTYTAIASGELAGPSTAVADLTAHPATSFEQYLRTR